MIPSSNLAGCAWISVVVIVQMILSGSQCATVNTTDVQKKHNNFDCVNSGRHLRSNTKDTTIFLTITNQTHQPGQTGSWQMPQVFPLANRIKPFSPQEVDHEFLMTQ